MVQLWRLAHISLLIGSQILHPSPDGQDAHLKISNFPVGDASCLPLKGLLRMVHLMYELRKNPFEG